MAALYHAMDDTLMTKSQLRASSYDDMREAITKEMLLSNSATRSWSDADLLRHFYDCEYGAEHWTTGLCLFQGCALIISGGKYFPMMYLADRFQVLAGPNC